MQGFNAMWMPGIDHASIAVHVLLEKDIKRRENKTRFDLGREEFMTRAWAWKERSGNRISEQEKLMGFSLDWARERFTMDERSNRAVREAFVQLYEEGLIFRAKRMINWDPGSETVVSDLEVDTVEENGSLWSIKYPIVGGGEDHRRDDAARDDARRHRGRGPREGRALPRVSRQGGRAAADRPADPDRADRHHPRRQGVARSGVRLRCGEGDAGARSERLRGQPDREPAGPRGHRSHRQDDGADRRRSTSA